MNQQLYVFGVAGFILAAAILTTLGYITPVDKETVTTLLTGVGVGASVATALSRRKAAGHERSPPDVPADFEAKEK